jgi:hypothetical protein
MVMELMKIEETGLFLAMLTAELNAQLSDSSVKNGINLCPDVF